MISRVLALFLVGLVSMFVACGVFSDAKSPALEVFKQRACYCNAFAPLAGSYERAETLVSQIQSGEIDVMSAIEALDATETELAELARALEGCRVVESNGGAGGSDASDAGAL